MARRPRLPRSAARTGAKPARPRKKKAGKTDAPGLAERSVRIAPGRVRGPGNIRRFPIRPPLRYPDPIGNLFDSARAGTTIVRPDDLMAMRVELRNMTIVPGAPPRLKSSGRGASVVILHMQPQSITEETFFETRPAGTQNTSGNPHKDNRPKPEPAGGGSEQLRAPPVRARIAGESRLAFQVPGGFDIPYTLEGLLEACQSLKPKVAANARPRPRPRLIIRPGDLIDRSVLSRMKPRQRAALGSFVLRSLQIGAVNGDDATLRMRQISGGRGLKPIKMPPGTGAIDRRILLRPPRPAAPNATTTAIEMPWRLIISPHNGTRWHHSSGPVTSPATDRTELWHSRLVAPNSSGVAIEPPYADRNRTIRAIWALSGENSTKSMSGAWPASADLPAPSTSPFRMPMDDFDRFQITHASSNFSRSAYIPEPVDTQLMMLTALGGWLDSRGAWEPLGMSIEEWVHRASMGRDHYVRIVYRGVLVPWGHRVSLVKISERKFHNGARGFEDRNGDGLGDPTIEQKPGNPAYLRQRMFLVMRERERRFDDPAYQTLSDKANSRLYTHQLPFSSVRILTQVTPNLDPPEQNDVASHGQRMFWPTVDGEPFKFQCSATDLDGKRVAFDLPMIFMDNTFAAPTNSSLNPDYATAEARAAEAEQAFRTTGNNRTTDLKLQRVALATSMKAGDTSVQVQDISFGAEVEAGNQKMRTASDKLSRPVFFPKVDRIEARIGALAHLSGSGKLNVLTWNQRYLKQGFKQNTGEVFVDVDIDPNPQMAKLDFSAQGDRSGGFVQPNLKPEALSRLAGPVMGDVDQFIDGTVPDGGGFPTSPGDLPLPLIFGCIPLGEIIKAVANLGDTPERIPKFGTESGTQIESFINALIRLFNVATDLAAQPGSIADAALTAFTASLADQLQQSAAYSSAQMAPIQAAIAQVDSALATLAGKIQSLIPLTVSDAPAAPGFGALPADISTARAAVANLVAAANANVGGVALPSGFRQSVLSTAQQLDDFLADLEALPTLITQGKALFDALDAIVGDPQNLGDLLSDPAQLKTQVEAVADAIGSLKTTVGTLHLIDGAPRNAIVSALAAVEDVFDTVADLLQLLEMLTGDELTIRFDWNPEIDSWWLPGANPATDDPIFRANDKRGFAVAVEAKVKKDGSTSPKISVTCGLKHFDLVLIAPASFLELKFEKIEFSVNSAAKMDVDVQFNEIKFVGPLSFVETLRDLIPLDGFSDPPALDISPQGIDASFSVALPTIAVGVLNISNISLGAGFTVPFIGQPLSVRFNFCTREQPFLLTVYMFGGGGFLGVTIDPSGVQILEASFEFGASLSIDLGVASGGVEVMAGIYFRMEQDAASLTGYFRLGGHVDVLGLITASLELYLELRYEFQSGKCVGMAQLTIEISVFIFSGSVTVRCERKFAGSNGDPNLRQMMGHAPQLPLEQELAEITGDDIDYAWREHCEAFA